MLVIAAILTSPALAAAATGAMPLDVALSRYLLVTGLCWVLLTAASEWLWSEAAATTDTASTSASPEDAPTSEEVSHEGR